jgi:two-component system sensor kinase FixL
MHLKVERATGVERSRQRGPNGPLANGAVRTGLRRNARRGVSDGQTMAGLRTVHEDLKEQHDALVDAYSRLEASYHRYTDLYDFAPVGYLTMSHNGVIREINLAGAQLLGLSRPRLLGTPLLCRIAHADRRKFLMHLSLCRRLAGRIATELELESRDRNEPTFVELISIPFVSPANGEKGYKSVITDITARRRAQASLRQARDELEQRVQERTRDLTRANELLRQEITARQALRESEERLRLMIEGTRDYAIILLDNAGCVASWNRGAQHITGYRAQEILGRHVSCLYTREDLRAGKPHRLLEAARATGRAEDEGWRMRKNGTRFWASVITTALYDEARRLRGFLKMTRDTTERRQAQELLRLSENRLADFFNHSPFGLIWVGPRGHIRRVNQAALELFGCTAEECLTHSVQEFFAEPALAANALRQLARMEILQGHRAQVRGKDGRIRHVLIDASGLWEQGWLVHSRWFVRDITPRVELEREILVIAERERQRIGQDLHDDLCQQLTGIEFLSETLAGRLRHGEAANAARAREIAQMVREAITRTRELAHGLSPVQLEAVGLPGALQQLAAQTRRVFKVDCRCRCQPGPVRGDYDLAIHLYRIAQEAVSNAIKHGHATRVDIGLARNNSRLALTVRDNGDGLPANAHTGKGMGLRVMRYRAGVIGGSLALKRNRGGGTAVVCTIRQV